jgi:hypothetical protein
MFLTDGDPLPKVGYGVDSCPSLERGRTARLRRKRPFAEMGRTGKFDPNLPLFAWSAERA